VSLPDIQAVKDRLRIETDIEDDDLEQMLASALATIEDAVGRPLTATQRTWTIEDWDGSCRSDRMFLPLYPVKHAGEDLVTITDADDEAVTDFRVNTQMGFVVASECTVFNNFPYTVTATVGLDLLPGRASSC
jgi:uncharacterized phiE125 gp8 family phage protein